MIWCFLQPKPAVSVSNRTLVGPFTVSPKIKTCREEFARKVAPFIDWSDIIYKQCEGAEAAH